MSYFMGELVKNSSISMIGSRRLVSKDASWGLLLNLSYGVVGSVQLVKSPKAQLLYPAPWLWIVLLPAGSNGDAAEPSAKVLNLVYTFVTFRVVASLRAPSALVPRHTARGLTRQRQWRQGRIRTAAQGNPAAPPKLIWPLMLGIYGQFDDPGHPARWDDIARRLQNWPSMDLAGKLFGQNTDSYVKGDCPKLDIARYAQEA